MNRTIRSTSARVSTHRSTAPRWASLLLGGLCIAWGACPALGQCTPQWSNAFPGLTAGPVLAMTTWDPDGAGPLPPVLVIGAAVNLAGGPSHHTVAYWDTSTSTWRALGSGMDDGTDIGPVRALTVYNGDLIATGRFTSAGGVGANSIARWSGTIAAGSWQPLGSGITGGNGGNALAVHGTDLIVGGNFFTAGGITGVGEIARWDGAAWHAMNNGFNAAVNAVYSYGGRVYASGGFSGAVNGVPLSGIGSWALPNGPWASPGPGIAGLGTAMTVYNGELIVGGQGVALAGPNPPVGVVRWSGSAWGVLGSGITGGAVNALTVYNDGAGPGLIAGGTFITAGGASANRIARWNGSTWQPLGSGMTDEVDALTVYNGQLVAAGNFHTAGGVTADFIAAYGTGSICPADFNCDGSLNSQDFFDFLAAFFAGVPNADFNGDGTINSQDFFDFIAAFFAGC